MDFGFARWFFLRGLALVYGIAFFSYSTQVLGLIGEQGILPARELLEAVSPYAGQGAYHRLPTFFWLRSDDLFLQGLCWAGIGLSVLLFFGLSPVPILFLLWALYLSLANVSQEFLSYQWDALLLEAGFLGIFLAPLTLRWKPNHPPPDPPRIAVWGFWWLLFRLVFSSGMVKLSSADPTWWNLSALLCHYQTQPLPTWIGWFAHQLPAWFQKVSCILMFGIELGVPFLIFAPRKLRIAACLLLVAFQLLIMATGNYSFFNWLTILLCMLLLDDGVWTRFFFRKSVPSAASRSSREWPRWILVPALLLWFAVSWVRLGDVLRRPIPWPRPLQQLAEWIAPFHIDNGYGLFAVMTTSRPEIILEGSENGQEWKVYEFRYKPGDLGHPPGFVAPHQPRLDWQMWFAALDSYQANPWFLRFCVKLLEGSPTVSALLKKNPFPGRPPRYLRATVWDYRFTDLAGLRREGKWWKSTRRGLYCPILSLRN